MNRCIGGDNAADHLHQFICFMRSLLNLTIQPPLFIHVIPDVPFCIAYDLLQPQISIICRLHIHIIHSPVKVLLLPDCLIQLSTQHFQFCVRRIRPHVQGVVFDCLNPISYIVNPYGKAVQILKCFRWEDICVVCLPCDSVLCRA